MVELRIDGEVAWKCDSSEKGIATLIAFAQGMLESAGVTKELPALTSEALPAA